MNPRTYMVPLVLGLALGARPVAGQQVVKKVVLDSVQSSLQRTLYALRDTLTLVDAATSRLARDRQTTSDALLRSRARLIAERCRAGAAMAVVAHEVVVKWGRPVPDKTGILPTLTESLVTLKRDMSACATEFSALTARERSQELRDYGVGRGAKVRTAIQRYESSVKTYFVLAIGDRYEPNVAGAGATPTSP